MIKFLLSFVATLIHLLTSPITLALSAGLLVATWFVCAQFRCQESEGSDRLMASEWLGA